MTSRSEPTKQHACRFCGRIKPYTGDSPPQTCGRSECQEADYDGGGDEYAGTLDTPKGSHECGW
jgi:hypothetical protein